VALIGLDSYRRALRLAGNLGLIIVLLFTGMGVLAPGAVAQATTWHAEFYNNVNLTGAPVLVRDDSSINFDWGNGSPGTGVNVDQFSVRWTSYVNFAAGNYTFRISVDDGVRLWVDEQLLIDQWHDQATTNYSAIKYLAAGYHSMRLEYYENTGGAVCKLWWDTGGGPITDWRGEYYNNTWLGGDPVLVRNDAVINFDWGYGSPASSVSADNFSVRWTRDAYFPSSMNYTFYATVDDGVRVWVDGALVVDRWYPQSRTTHTATIYLGAGTHQVRVEYFEATGFAVCMVNWSGGGVYPPPVVADEIVVDDRDGRFVWGGASGSWYSRATGYASHLYWTWNAQSTVRHWAKWYPYVSSAGNWEAYVYIASRYFGSKSARYAIYHNGVRDDRIVNQNNYYNQWISLGTYYFGGGPGEYVYLSDATGEVNGTRYVGFDAVKFVRRDGSPVPPPPPPPGPGPGPVPGCSIYPTLGFGRVWNTYANVRNKLGCATEMEKSVWAGEESFQGGYMFWRQDTLTVYVLYNNGTWQSFPDTWTSAEPEWDPSIVAPPGYYQPKRGFGKVWRNNAGVRNALGWGLNEERGFTASVQQFGGGMMYWSNTRGIYALYGDARWEHYD
jgi:hypothetical protein